uniref:Uncharacterized protein n=1 Tax=Meloidogyne enterolobii TaxID=390850 RepID=A0A6V7TJQ8_MELEN|nr:unnamed protein product [Meloidogyne enterolobii]
MGNISFILLFASILFLAIFKNVKTSEGVFLWETMYRVSSFKCLKEKYSKEFVIINSNYYDTGKVDTNAELNIINARTAGIENVDIYFSPCIKPSSASELICGDARESIIFVLDHLNKNNAKFGRVWLYIYGLTGCNQYEGWNKNNKTKNIEYIDKETKLLDFFTNKYNWHEITGNTRKYNNTPLLYYNVDQKDNFEDYNEYGYPFGGWEKPTIKEYNFTSICDIDVANLLKI